MSDRLEKLQQMLAQDPSDVFLRYAIALELDKLGRIDEALAIHQDLMTGQPAYVPSFFMAGQALARESRTDEAREILTAGIEHAKSQNNHHAAAEMEGFLDMLD